MGTCCQQTTNEKKTVYGSLDRSNSVITSNRCCDQPISECKHLDLLTAVSNKYYMNYYAKNSNIRITEMLNDFLHLIQHHNGDDEVDFVANYVGHCDASKCQIFRRKVYNDYKSNQNAPYVYQDVIRKQILDKIHCHFHHSIRLTTKDKMAIKNNYVSDNVSLLSCIENKSINKIHQILSTKQCVVRDASCRYSQLFSQQKQNHNADRSDRMYSFGYDFLYGYQNEDKWRMQENDGIKISKKYKTLKSELTENGISTISMKQFDIELKKTEIHYESDYRQQWYPEISMENLLSLMIYCNYTELQYQFSKTYRVKYKNKLFKYGLSHDNFYHLGKNLKICVLQFGTKIDEGNVKTFYHGISEKLLFPAYINQYNNRVLIKCPLSTSSSFEVALNFTNNSNGLIIEFSEIEWVYPPKYFSVSWLSDYSHESEYLFLQNQHPLQVVNIIDTEYGVEYKMILSALRIIELIMSNQRVCYTYELMEQLITKIFLYKLSMDIDRTFMTEYSKKLIDTYFENKINVSLDFTDISGNPFLSKLFISDCYCIKIKEINKLFLNMEHFTVIKLPAFHAGPLLDLLSTTKLKQINLEVIGGEIGTDWNNEWQTKWKRIKLNIHQRKKYKLLQYHQKRLFLQKRYMSLSMAMA